MRIKLTERSKGKIEALLLNSVKRAGSYEPDRVLLYFEENLTGDEYDACQAFLTWVIAGDKGFGWNLWTVWDEWQASLDA